MQRRRRYRGKEQTRRLLQEVGEENAYNAYAYYMLIIFIILSYDIYFLPKLTVSIQDILQSVF